MRTKWKGLWYQNEGSNLYISPAFSKKEFVEKFFKDGRKRTRVLVKHNKYYNKDRNTPRLVFSFSNQTSDEAEYYELEELKGLEKNNSITTDFAIDFLVQALNDLEFGFDKDDLIAEYSTKMRMNSYESYKENSY